MQICIAFTLHQRMIVIPKSTKPKRLAKNIKLTEIKLDADDMQCLKGVDKNFRLLKLEFFLKQEWKWQEAWDIEEDEKFMIKLGICRHYIVCVYWFVSAIKVNMD